MTLGAESRAVASGLLRVVIVREDAAPRLPQAEPRHPSASEELVEVHPTLLPESFPARADARAADFENGVAAAEPFEHRVRNLFKGELARPAQCALPYGRDSPPRVG